MVHECVHKDYSFELVANFQNVSLLSTVVVLQVLSAALAGGTEDRYSWKQDEYMKRKYPNIY